ncbi:unnamed protein product [Scytosiphon promiscuus]
MRTSNRGDVPAPHAPPGQVKGGVVDDVVFDAGSLSFVQDWVEPAREDPRKSNPNRRLGVGAQPKKPKPERPLPSALEKKMLRKRQRQELSDAIAGEMDTHGVVNGDEEKDGESKTASFKKSKTKKTKAAPIDHDTTTIDPDPAPASGKEKRGGVKRETEGAVSTSEGEGVAEKSGGNGDGEKQGRKRKARRKKNKGAATEVAAEEAEVAAADGETPSQGPATAMEDGSSGALKAAVAGDGEDAGEVTAGESKKQRRGWGKARPKATVAAAASADGIPSDNATDEGGRNGTGAHERRQRKKTRSKQKNIRKDKRPMEQRPAYVRAGDPEFCGRGLTDETRKFLGLPELKDFGDAPPAGWGQPGKAGAKPGWVIDKKPRRLPKDLVPDATPMAEEGERRAAEKGAAAGSGGAVEEAAAPVASSKGAASSAVSLKSKSKYKNLTLPLGTKADKKREKKAKRSSSGGDGESRKPKGKSKKAP